MQKGAENLVPKFLHTNPNVKIASQIFEEIPQYQNWEEFCTPTTECNNLTFPQFDRCGILKQKRYSERYSDETCKAVSTVGCLLHAEN